MLAALLREPRRLRLAGDAASAALRQLSAAASDPASPPQPSTASDAAADAAPTRRRQRTGVRGEKAADGRPALDPRTVAHLVDSGLFPLPADAARALGHSHRRYPAETALPAADWLRATFPAQRSATSRSGLGGAARIIARRPVLLASSVEPMRSRWEALLAPREAGGLGLRLPVALKRVEGYPHFLTMPTATLRAKVALLEELGAADATATLAKAPSLAGLAPATLAANAAWLAEQKLDLGRAFAQAPALFYLARANLAPKFDFLRCVAHLSDADINFDPTVLGRSLEHRLRPRFFFALYFGAHDLMRFTSLAIKPDSDAIAFVQKRVLANEDEAVAADWSLGWHNALLASDAFNAWAARAEAQRRAQWQRTQDAKPAA